MEPKLNRILDRAFTLFLAHFVGCLVLGFVGARSRGSEILLFLVFGSTLTMAIYLRAAKNAYEAIAGKPIKWHTHQAMLWGIWVMGISSALAFIK